MSDKRGINAMNKPNPQGKASLPLLAALQSARPQQVFEKPASDIVQDFCLSALVLGAHFRFKPVPGKTYYLYLHGGTWKLSLVAPEEWAMDASRHFVAGCRLHIDMTWQLEPAADVANIAEVQAALEAHVAGFNSSVSESGSIEAALPFYLATLPYYQRVLASGLAVSLGHSILLLDAPERQRLTTDDGLMPALRSPPPADDHLSSSP